jgi:uncharacterized protein (DUF1810 family)
LSTPKAATCAQALAESAQALLDSGATDPEAALGPIDAVKLRSSMTLFARAAPDEPVFRDVIDRLYGGRFDDATDRLLEGQPWPDPRWRSGVGVTRR